MAYGVNCNELIIKDWFGMCTAFWLLCWENSLILKAGLLDLRSFLFIYLLQILSDYADKFDRPETKQVSRPPSPGRKFFFFFESFRGQAHSLIREKKSQKKKKPSLFTISRTEASTLLFLKVTLKLQ